ncbi:MAG: sterol desaturase family protein [Maricaulaceae bacterium]
MELVVSVLSVFGLVFAVFAVRALSLVGLGFAMLRFWRFARKRLVFQLPYAEGQLRREAVRAALVVVFDATVVTAAFLTGLVARPETAPVWAGLATFAAMFIWYELWFYGTHRAMHHKSLLWIHRAHHDAKICDPLTSLSFSLGERAILLIGVIGFAAVASRLMPFDVRGLMAYALFNYTVNVIGHSNAEIYPRWLIRSPVGGLIATPSYHALHHARFRGHYGLFTTVLDRLLGTAFEDRAAVYERAAAGTGLHRLSERLGQTPPGDAPQRPPPLPAE